MISHGSHQYVGNLDHVTVVRLDSLDCTDNILVKSVLLSQSTVKNDPEGVERLVSDPLVEMDD
jgi:hypothetical protein